ncbi:MAG TPA: tetratricopeptide repeat protein [Candidatus Cryosericum sp.]|jgi:Tfp pilus assembly protein PilF|nr:tetratricopeptide repeat protein [Candidatus Cryosericum sp.]
MTLERDPKLDRALRLLERAYERQRAGDFEAAVRLYKASIEERPTAEAHTYLGWTYSYMGRYDDAIEQCKVAILVDPEFGNPYNDIGSYLIQKGELEKAIPWLELAKKAPRYEPRHFPYLNLFRVYIKQGRLDAAQREFEQARFIQQTVELETGTATEEDLGGMIH